MCSKLAGRYAAVALVATSSTVLLLASGSTAEVIDKSALLKFARIPLYDPLVDPINS